MRSARQGLVAMSTQHSDAVPDRTEWSAAPGLWLPSPGVPGSISVRTRKRLWMRSRGRCAFPRCTGSLLEPIQGADEDTIVGIECHIVAREDDPTVARSVSSLTPTELREFAELITDRRGYSNLVLMCPRHSLVIDDRNFGIRHRASR